MTIVFIAGLGCGIALMTIIHDAARHDEEKRRLEARHRYWQAQAGMATSASRLMREQVSQIIEEAGW